MREVVGCDTETTGLDLEFDRAVCVAFSYRDEVVFCAFGHPEGNNVTREDVQRILDRLRRDNAIIVMHNAQFDVCMLLNCGFDVPIAQCEDTMLLTSLLNESEPSYSLDALAYKYCDMEKHRSSALNEYAAEHFGGRAETEQQVKNYHKCPGTLVQPYCEQDARMTRALYLSRRPAIDDFYDNQGHSLAYIYDIERRLLPFVVKMHRVGVRVDVARAEAESANLDSIEAQLKEEWDATYTITETVKGKPKKGIPDHLITRPANQKSSIDMLELFNRYDIPYTETDGSQKPKFDKYGNPICESCDDCTFQSKDDEVDIDSMGVETCPYRYPDGVVDVRGCKCEKQLVGRIIPKTDKHTLAEIEHPMGKAINHARKIEKINKDFLKAYILKNADERGLVHGQFHQLKGEEYGTISGRFSSGGKLNLQNVTKYNPKDTDDPYLWLKKTPRSVFIPYRDDMQWCSIDWSQIEYRIFAWYAALSLNYGGLILKEYIRDPLVDYHDMVSELTGIIRRQAKNINFAILYGAGAAKIQKMCEFATLEEAKAVLKIYNERAPEANALMKLCIEKADASGYVRTWWGRVLRFQKSQDPDSRNVYDKIYAALNRVIQGTAADLMKIKMVELWESGVIDWQNIICHMTIHDELCFSVVRGEEGDRIIRTVKAIMEDVPSIGCPILAAASTGPNWAELTPF